MASPGQQGGRRRGGREGGFTVIEVLIAAFILVLGGIAVFSVIGSATRNTYRAEQSQVIGNMLQQEMEKIKQLPYSQVALTALPTHSSDQANPNYRVTAQQFNVNRSGSASNWNLVYNGGHSNQTGGTVSCPLPDGTSGPCGISPGPTPFTSGNVSGNIYRYVVWEPVSACSNCAHDANSDVYNGQRAPWIKHVIVAVALNGTGTGATRPYQELQGDIGNPDEGQGTCTGSGCSGTSTNNATPWTFWLTDTPCDQTQRQSIAGDHLTHDTLGVCSKGMTTGPPGALGANAGAPDLMFTKATPCAADDCTGPQPLNDYATDVEPAQNPTQDKGLQERVPTNVLGGGSGCLTDLNGPSSLLSLGSDPEWYIHKWVSNPIPGNFSSVVLDGTGQLDLWTQTISGSYNGRICVWLFDRVLNGLGAPVDTFAVSLDAHDECNTSRALTLSLTYFQCSKASWPSGGWSEIAIPLNFAQLTLPANHRLGVAIGVERSGTLPGDGLQFMYDHPTYDSRLIINTHSLLPF